MQTRSSHTSLLAAPLHADGRTLPSAAKRLHVRWTGIDFVPLQKERYDLVFKKKDIDTKPMRALMGILETGILKEEFSSLGGYDTSDMGKIMWMG